MVVAVSRETVDMESIWMCIILWRGMADRSRTSNLRPVFMDLLDKEPENVLSLP